MIATQIIRVEHYHPPKNTDCAQDSANPKKVLIFEYFYWPLDGNDYSGKDTEYQESCCRLGIVGYGYIKAKPTKNEGDKEGDCVGHMI